MTASRWNLWHREIEFRDTDGRCEYGEPRRNNPCPQALRSPESTYGLLNFNSLYGQRFAIRREAKDEVMDWLNFYNHKRLHSTLGYSSPTMFEQRWTAAQQQDRKSG